MTSDTTLHGPRGLTYAPHTREVWLNDSRVPLARRETDLLAVLLEDRGRVIPFAELAMRAWGFLPEGDTRFIYTSIWRLRQMLAHHGLDDVITSVRAVGYSIEEDGPAPGRWQRGQVIVDVSAPGRPLLMASPSTAALRGSGILDLEHQAWTDMHDNVWSDADRKRISRAVDRAMSDGSEDLEELRWPLPDGSVAELDLHLARLMREGGQPHLLVDIRWQIVAEPHAVPPVSSNGHAA